MRTGTGAPLFKPPAILAALGLLLFAGLAMILHLSGIFMPAFDKNKLGTIDYEITYCSTNGVDLGMDIYYPSNEGPWPALIFVHGGGWMEGDKAGLLVNPEQAGFLVASISYRMYPDYQFPKMIEDVKCAIRFLRAHASQYDLDPERIALVGHSAGGHLVALGGLADESAGWDVGQYLTQSSRVQAVVVIAGPSDLTRNFSKDVSNLIQNVFGPEQLISGSPVTYASPDDPPFLVIHGDADPVVPVEQAYLLHEALLEVGIRSELLIVKNGGHGLEPVGGGNTTPSGDGIYEQAILFLKQNLQSP